MGLFYIALMKNIFASSYNIMYTFAVSQKFLWRPKITLITEATAVGKATNGGLHRMLFQVKFRLRCCSELH